MFFCAALPAAQMPQSPKESADCMQLGTLALENQAYSAAADYFERALNGLREPAERQHATERLQYSLLRSGNIQRATALLTATRENPEFKSAGNLLKLMTARELFYHGKYAETIALCSNADFAAADENFLQYERLNLLARACTMQKDAKGAYENFSELLKIAPEASNYQFTALEGMILSLLELNRISEARSYFQKLVKALPDSLNSLLVKHMRHLDWLLQCYEGKTAEVEALFEQEVAEARTGENPLLARTALQLADAHLKVNGYDRAVKFQQMALQLAEDGFQSTVYRALLASRIEAEKYAEALEDITVFLEKFPHEYDYCNMKLLAANLHNRLQHNEEAQKIYRQLFEDKQTPQTIRYTAAQELGKLYQRSSRQDDAVRYMTYAIKMAPDANAAGNLQRQLGEYLYQLSRYQQASEQFRAAVKSGNLLARLWLAQTLYQLKNYREADRELKQFKVSGNADLVRRKDYLQALLDEKLQDRAAAVRSYMGFFSKYPQAPEAPDALFQAAELTQSSNLAIKLFTQYAKKFPRDERAGNALYKALVLQLQNKQEKAARATLEHLKKDYSGSKFTFGGYFALIDFLRSTPAEAMKVLDELAADAPKKYPALIPELLYERARLNLELKQHTAARSALLELTSQYPGHAIAPQAFFVLGDLNFSLGKYQEALTAFQRALERAGGGAFAYGCSGRSGDAAYALYTTTGQKQYLLQATDCYKNLLKASDLPPEFYFQSLYKLGLCQKDSGDAAAALRSYREVLYRAWQAKRSNKFYSKLWSAKALDAALKILNPALGKAADKVSKQKLQQEIDQLMRIAAALGLTGEATAAQPEQKNGK